MTAAVVVLFTLYGLTFMFWTAIGCLRFVNERGGRTWLRGPAVTGAGAGVLSAIIFGIFVVLLQAGIELLALPVGSDPAAAIPAAIALVLGWVAAASFGARLIAGRWMPLARRFLFCGVQSVICTLAILPIYWELARAALVRDELAAASVLGLQLIALAGGLLGTWYRVRSRNPLPGHERKPVTPDQVAVLIAAHNEEACIGLTIESALRVVGPDQIFVGSDGSSDRTVEIVESYGCQVVDFQPNRGKAGALKGVIDQHDLCNRFEAILILDADAEVDPHFLENGLPLLDDPAVSAIAGHVITKWHPHRWPRWSMLFPAYRTRLYLLLQAMLRYGQTWMQTNVTYIIPGAGSIYRTDIIPIIDITAPGLIIEDFNMTFELHHKKLGKVAYSPNVKITCEDPISLRDYWSQVRRWSLGFWQTVIFQGVWPSTFWLALAPFIVEIMIISIFFALVPILAVTSALDLVGYVAIPAPNFAGLPLDLWDLFLAVIVADYALTVIIATIERRPLMLVYGFAFLILRWVDAALFLWTLPQAFFAKSNGMWTSPKRPAAA